MKALFMVAMLVTASVLIPPTNPLYSLKIAIENFMENVVAIFNPQMALNMKIQHLHERVIELYYLEKVNKTYLAPEVMALIYNELQSIRQFCETHNCTMTPNMNMTINRTIDMIRQIQKHTNCTMCKEKLEAVIGIIKNIQKNIWKHRMWHRRHWWSNTTPHYPTTPPSPVFPH